MKNGLVFIKQRFLQSPDRRAFWFGLALLVKGIIFLSGMMQFSDGRIPGLYGVAGGDTFSYLDPMEHFIREGTYQPDFRMPGFVILYIPLRMVFSMAATCNIIIVLQWILASLSVYYLAKSAWLLAKSTTLFYLVYYVFLINTYSNLFDYYFLSDSFCCSAGVFMVYFLARYLEAQKSSWLFIAGVFFTWMVFLRQPYILLGGLILFPVVMLWKERKLRIKQAFLACLLFFSSFVIADMAWIWRNYKVHDQFIPLRKTVFYETENISYIEPLSGFVKAFGGDICFWNPTAEIRWFNMGANYTAVPYKIDVKLPDDIYTSAFNADSLLLLKRLVTITQLHDADPAQLKAARLAIGEKCTRYEASIRNEKPMLYYVTARFRVAHHFLFFNGTYNLFNKVYEKLNIWQKLLKIGYSLLYYGMVVLCLLGVVCFPYRQRMSLFFWPVLYSFILFPFVFSFSEYRYLVPAYPFMVVTACYLCWHYYRKFTSLKQ